MTTTTTDSQTEVFKATRIVTHEVPGDSRDWRVSCFTGSFHKPYIELSFRSEASRAEWIANEKRSLSSH